MGHLVKNTLQSSRIIRRRRVNGRYVVTIFVWKRIESSSICGDGPILARIGIERIRWVRGRRRHGKVAEPCQQRPDRYQQGLRECPCG